MKPQKLLLGAATAFMLVGASGAAMADNTCLGGFLGGVIDDDVTITAANSCVIQEATVNGDITASGAANVSILRSTASGNILIEESRIAAVVLSAAKNIRLLRNDVAIASASIANKWLRVNRNNIASVKQNGAVLGIVCLNNGEFEAARNNTEGEEECNEAGN